jgi:DNA-binding transcriptional MerR regulator
VASEPADRAAQQAEWTIDQLAARAGLTVRNVRAYTTRGLLPAPRLRGRTGYYGPEHLARLSVLTEMLDEGYTLAAVERVLASVPAGVTESGLALHRALLTPFLPEEPEEVDLATLQARTGSNLDPALLTELRELGVLEPVGDGRFRAPSPTLLRAGLQVVALGVPVDQVVRAQREVATHAQAVAQIYVQLFVDSIWQRLAGPAGPAGGGPAAGGTDTAGAGALEIGPQEWAQIREAVELVQPVASQALLASFRLALAGAVAEALGQLGEDASLADPTDSGGHRPTPSPPARPPRPPGRTAG